MNFLFFDTETTGLPNRSQPLNHPTQPHITQLGAVLQVNGQDIIVVDTLIKPDGWKIGARAKEITGITEEMCEESGIPIADAVDMFMVMAANADFIVCHNVSFDKKLMSIEYSRLNQELHPSSVMLGKPTLCTMLATTPICKLKKGDNRTDYKWPKLTEAMMFFFNEELENAHSAIVDIKATQRLFNLLVEEGHFDAQFDEFKAAKEAA